MKNAALILLLLIAVIIVLKMDQVLERVFGFSNAKAAWLDPWLKRCWNVSKVLLWAIGLVMLFFWSWSW